MTTHNTREEDKKEKHREARKRWNAKYRRTHPWANRKGLLHTRTILRNKGHEESITTTEIGILWHRDKAYEMKKPSLDRINNDKGYTFENCRFIEFSLNASLGSKYRTVTPKSIEASKRNLAPLMAKLGLDMDNLPAYSRTRQKCHIDGCEKMSAIIANRKGERRYSYKCWAHRHTKRLATPPKNISSNETTV